MQISKLRSQTLPAALFVAVVGCGSGSVSRSGEEIETKVDWKPPKQSPEGSPVAKHGQLRLEGTQIVDESGDPIQLEGISTQWLNFEGSFSSSKDAVLWMRDHWDVELIRGAMGVEETGGYLAAPGVMRDKMERVIQNAIDAGLYVIVDWHDHYAHDHEAQAVRFFKEMAEKWGDYPNIIWETYNEPWGEVDWLTQLRPYHEATVAAIRSRDPDNLIVLGNPFWSQRPNEPLRAVAGGDAGVEPAIVEGDNLMYTLHFYACTHGADVRANGQAALDAGLPVFVTEWGATTADGGILEQGGRFCEDEGREWMEWIDENHLSWAAWRLQACSEISCILAPGSRYAGDWTDADLNGHGAFVVENLMN